MRCDWSQPCAVAKFALVFGHTIISLKYCVGQVERSLYANSIGTATRHAAACADTYRIGQTDGQTDRRTDRRIAALLYVPPLL